MRTAGIFHELWPIETLDQPRLAESLGEAPLPDAPQIIAYLRSGVVLIDTMDATEDVLTRDEWLVGASSVLTDGE